MTSSSTGVAERTAFSSVHEDASTRRHRRTLTRRMGRTLIWVCCLLWACVAVWPLLAMARLGFESTAAIFIHPLGIGGGWTLSSYKSVWNGPPAAPGIARLALNSVEAVVPTLVLSIAGGFACAYGLSALGPPTFPAGTSFRSCRRNCPFSADNNSALRRDEPVGAAK